MFNKKTIFINTASQVFVRFVTLAFTLISIKLLSSYLGPAGVGKYNTITTYINFFIVIADLGLFSVAVREISKKPEDERKIISNVFTIRLVTALAAALVAISLVMFTKYDNEIKSGVMIASGFLFFNLMASVYDMVLQYRLKMQYSALAELLSKLVAIIALYLVIRANGNFIAIISTVTISGLCIFIFKWLFAKKYLKFGFKFDRQVALWIFNLSWPIGIVFIINNLYFKLDTLMLFAIKGAAAVGIYSVAFKILETTAFVGSYFAGALKPAISENIEKNKEFVGKLISKSISIMVFVAIPLSIVSIVFAKEIILFLSTPDFISGSRALVFLSFTLPLIYLDALLIEVLIANDERKLMIKIAIFIVIFNLIANLIFIPLYSFMGAAFTTMLSELVLLFINIYYTKKIVKYHINWPVIMKILLAGLITMAITFVIKGLSINFIILSVISLAIFGMMTMLLKIFTAETFLELLRKKQ